MKFRLTIEGKEDTIILKDKEISCVEVKFDGPDEAQKRGNINFAVITVKGKIEEGEGEENRDLGNIEDTKKIFNWAFLNNGDIYRKLTLMAIAEAGNIVVRKYEFSDTFVVDYKEYFHIIEGAVFELILKQRVDKMEKDNIKISGNYSLEE